MRSFIYKWFVSKSHPYETRTRLGVWADRSCKYLLDVLFYLVAVSLFLGQLTAPVYEVVPTNNVIGWESQTDYPLVTEAEATQLKKEFHAPFRFTYWFLGIGLVVYLLTRLTQRHYRKRLKKKLKIFS